MGGLAGGDAGLAGDDGAAAAAADDDAVAKSKREDRKLPTVMRDVFFLSLPLRHLGGGGGSGSGGGSGGGGDRIRSVY